MVKLIPLTDYENYFAGSDGCIYRAVKDKRCPSYPLKKVGNTVNAYGYKILSIPGRSKAVHILIATAFHGPKPSPESQVRHLNGQRSDNRPSNLAWGNYADQAADKAIHGTINKGTKNGRAILSDSDVKHLRLLRSKGATYQELAEKFSISHTCARLVAQRKTWSSV